MVDTGIGIPKEKRMSVFENYVQVNNGHGGTGLGLGIVQSFVSCYSNILYTYMYLLYSLSLSNFGFNWMIYVDLDHRYV